LRPVCYCRNKTKMATTTPSVIVWNTIWSHGGVMHRNWLQIRRNCISKDYFPHRPQL
jgi:hypothetical protein